MPACVRIATITPEQARRDDVAFSSDFVVVGGGLVGAAIAYGLAKAGEQVLLLDEGDIAFRAARGNFGNVWVQGKGASSPPTPI